MNPKHKELLLKDLCARLPYGVKVAQFGWDKFPCTVTKIDIKLKKIFCPEANCYQFIDVIKPYLRPMSSMTEEEENEYRAINCYEGLFPRNENALDYVLSHHFDYRGLIPMGLALEAKEGMYKTE